MSRIQDILSKAERDGTARRTRSVPEESRAAEDRPYGPRSVEPRTIEPPPLPRRAFRTDSARVSAAPATPEPFTLRSQPDPDDGTATADAATERAGGLDRLLVAALAPASIAAEQYRALRTRLKRTESDRALRTIAITSPAKGDGKSITAANLALTMAQEFQQRVLLLDADLRRPAVHRLFGVADSPGLAEVLMNVAELEHALVPVG
jgi:hypothetical protein